MNFSALSVLALKSPRIALNHPTSHCTMYNLVLVNYGYIEEKNDKVAVDKNACYIKTLR